MISTRPGTLSAADAGLGSASELKPVITGVREQWAAELKPPGDTRNWGIERIAREVADRVCLAINEYCEGGSDLKALRKTIQDACVIGEQKLLQPQALNKWSFDGLRDSASKPEIWKHRIIGRMREKILGLEREVDTKRSLFVLVQNDPVPEIIMGTKGCMRVSELLCGGSMFKAYKLMSAVCKAEGIHFKKLEWGACFIGSVKEFNNLRAELAQNKHSLQRSSFFKLKGYVNFAEERCGGSMGKAYKLMSAVCKAEGIDFKKLEWGACFIGSAKEFSALRNELNENKHSLQKSSFFGLKGYLELAKERCSGSMLKAYMLISAVCKAEGIDFKKLEWNACFQGSVKEFNALRDELNENKHYLQKSSFFGLKGYVNFAEERCASSMQKAYKLMSAVCKAERLDFKKLEWEACFNGNVKEFNALRDELNENSESLQSSSLSGIHGYVKFAEERCAGRMQKAYLLMSAVCQAEGINFKKFEWGAQFGGSVKEFNELRNELNENKESLQYSIFSGIQGYVKFAEERCAGSMKKAYMLMSAVCKAEKIDFKKLEWEAKFNGSVKEFNVLRDELKNNKGFLQKSSFVGLNGYVEFAEERCAGSMAKAYNHMSAVCKAEKIDFKKLEWGACFHGSVKEFGALRNKLKESKDSLQRSSFFGLKGYVEFAEVRCAGSMLRAHKLMSAVCKAEGIDLKKLEWGAQFGGSVAGFNALRNELNKNKDSLQRSSFFGPKGYLKFAEERCSGSMIKAQVLMSAICKAEGVDFKKLEWGARFDGTVEEYLLQSA